MPDDRNQPTAGEAPAPELEYAAELAASADAFAQSLGKLDLDSLKHQAVRPDTSRSARDIVSAIPVSVRIVLGSATLLVAELVGLAKGAVVPLDRKIGDPSDLYVNGRLFARGEIVLLDEATQKLGFAVIEICSDDIVR
jgi:flagellar motor switch protein FliN